ncbi:MAG: ribulose-phosphate 3-epimerase [Bacteroidia bacterium]|nr:ribulose-phosphate 3-epimerase [Bacteroidia bacterium]
MTPIIAPSVLACDFGKLAEEIKMINESQADWIHVDIMDGVFVPNLSMGLPVVQAIQRVAQKPMDVHLMIQQPERYVEAFKDAGAAIISVHAEACIHLHRNIEQIKSLGCKAGVALNPHTPISVLENVINDIDLICVMSVNPGFGGQKFIENTYEKVRQLSALIEARGADALIEIDGGVNIGNATTLVEAGADILVAGNFVFSSNAPKQIIAELKAIGSPQVR